MASVCKLCAFSSSDQVHKTESNIFNKQKQREDTSTHVSLFL